MTGLRLANLLHPPETVAPAISPAVRVPGVLTITADIRLYSGVLGALGTERWRAPWARSMRSALELCAADAVPIVVYDIQLPGEEWTCALQRLGSFAHAPRILLAAASINEDLWRTALRCRGYDVVNRSAGSGEWNRVLRFAWISL